MILQHLYFCLFLNIGMNIFQILNSKGKFKLNHGPKSDSIQSFLCVTEV